MNLSAVVALDVAVLLPPPFRQHLVRLNAGLTPPPGGFHFDDTHLPHVSLVQQFVPLDTLDGVIEETENVLHRVAPLELLTRDCRAGRTTSAIRLADTQPLTRLHTHLLDRLRRFETAHGDPSAFVSGEDEEEPRAADVRWVRRFREAAAYDDFDPHITVGVGAVSAWSGPSHCVATKIALCHLGRFCTCRRVLAEWTLTPQNA